MTARAVILAWVISKGFQPIFQSKNRLNIEENLKALNFTLLPKDMSQIDLSFPFENNRVTFLKRDDFLVTNES